MGGLTYSTAAASLLLFWGRVKGKSVEESVAGNTVGRCRWPAVPRPQDAHAFAVGVSRYTAGKEEESTYLALPETLTLASKEFGTSDKATRWAEQKEAFWQLPLDHPRHDRKMCVSLAERAGRDGRPRKFYDEMRRKEVRELYILHAKDALIHEKGLVGLDCGYIQHHDSCETHYKFIGRKWYADCQKSLADSHLRWSSLFSDPAKYGMKCLSPPINATSYSVVDRVFMITAGWDNNYHHFLVDSLTRLIRHFDWLQANPDIKIHIRGFEVNAKKERYVQWGRDLRLRVTALLGLDHSRFITGPTIARNVWMPREARCNYPISHAHELRLLAHRMLRAAYGKENDAEWASLDLFGPGRPLHRKPSSSGLRVVLQHRHCLTEKTCRKEKWRELDGDTFQIFLRTVKEILKPERIDVFSSSNMTQKSAEFFKEEIAIYSQADVIIGSHGAGFTNMMFMKPGTTAFEIVGSFDGRFTPVCGYHGPFASVFGINHFIYSFDFKAASKNFKLLRPLNREHFVNITQTVASALRTFSVVQSQGLNLI